MKQQLKKIRLFLWCMGGLFILLNILAAIHAWKFTHFSAQGLRNEELHLTPATQLRLLFMGVDNPRPMNTTTPQGRYEALTIPSNVPLSCWYLYTTGTPKGTVILFHGYTGNKSQLLPRAAPLLAHGYNCLVVDFMGSGESGGNSTTIGFMEAQEVRDCYEYLQKRGDTAIYLLGSSMGAAAIMKAMHDYPLHPRGAVLECPFATMWETTCIRFKALHVPVYPMAPLLVFWGGAENGFWGFGHNPVDYAPSVTCPTLLQYGAHDDRVARSETDRILARLPHARLVVYEQAGHDNYLRVSPSQWTKEVVGFLD
ncbi:MAG: alpha/beta fold hydrolase, partial [Chitinophagia bacterium]|nr:alpha/beta fold hydrolase [Chitinophagia bacterium]